MLATQSGELNLNIDQKTLEACLKPIQNITNTTYQNVCTGQSVIVPAGTFDYVIFFLFIVPVSIFIILELAKLTSILFFDR